MVDVSEDREMTGGIKGRSGVSDGIGASRPCNDP